MFRSLLSFIPVLLATSMIGCVLPSRADDSAEIQRAAGQKPLPIRGTWTATQMWGFQQNESGQTVPLRVGKSQLNKESWTLKFELNSEGDGYIGGLAICQLKAKLLNGVSKNLAGSSVLLTANGIVGGLHLLATVIEMGRCVNSETGFIETLVPVARLNNFFGQSDPFLDKNVGFVGEGASSTAAESECRRLRGVRFININGSSACVGFRDALANQIRIITVPAGSIHAVRVDFVRE